MKKTDLYLLLSLCAWVLTFLTGLGFILSIVVLFLIGPEKEKLKEQLTGDSLRLENRKLTIAQILSGINIVAFTIILGFAAYLFLDYFQMI